MIMMTDISREQEIRDKLQKILSSEQFAGDKKDTGLLHSVADLIKAAVEWIGYVLKKLVGNLGLPEDGMTLFGRTLPPVTTLILKISGVVFITALIFVIVYFIIRNLGSSRRIKQKEDALLLDALKDADAVEQKAMEYSRNGEYKLGLRFLYISLLIHFNEKNIIRLDKSKTNKQYLKEVQRGGHARFDTFAEFTGVFNEVWYGNREASGEMFRKWHENFILLAKEGSR